MTTAPENPARPPPRTSVPIDEGSAIDLLALLAPLRKHWLTAVAVAVVVTVAVSFWTMRQTKIYEAVASVQFDPNPPRPLGGRVESVVEMGNGAFWDTREYYETQYQIIQSRRVGLGVVQKLGLTTDARFLYNLPPSAPTPDFAEPVPEEDAAEAVRGRIRVDPVKSSRIALVRVTDADPDRAMLLAKTVVEVYREQNVDTVLESTDEAISWLHREHDKLKGELESSEMSLHTYKEDKNLLSVEYTDQSNMLREEIAQLNGTLTTIHTHREEVAARYAELSRVPASDPSQIPASELLQSESLQSLRTQFVQAVRDRDSLMKEGLGRNHPDVLSADSKVEITKAALLAEIKNIQGALERDLAIVNRQESGVSGLFERAKKQALDLNLNEIEYNRLRRQKDNTEKLYSLVLERSKESELTRQLRVNNVSIVDLPMRPGGPIRPNVPLNTAVGLLMGTILGIALALMRGLLDRTVKTPDDVEKAVGATFLGLMPEVESKTLTRRKRRERSPHPNELLVHDEPLSSVAEAARTIRTSLLFMSPDKPFRTLLVTSAGPSEGKTTVACYIATAMAQAGKRVLLVDCDLRRPRIHRIFGGPGRDMGPGLTSTLLEEGVGDPVIPTEVPDLFVVPAGPIPPNPSELLHSEKFRQFLKRMQGRFDQVILDSPPVVAVTDATILSTLVDGTVLVIRAHKTRKDLARHGYRLLADVGANLAGVLLNAVNFGSDEYRYSYRYYRRADYYGAEAEAAASGRARRGPDRGDDRPAKSA